MAAFALHTEGLTGRFARVSAVKDVTFGVEPGETVRLAELYLLRCNVVEVSYRDTPPPVGDVPLWRTRRCGGFR